jgi:hypothetical protein
VWIESISKAAIADSMLGARNQGAVRRRREEIRARLHEPCTEVVQASDASIWSLVRPTLVTLPFCLRLSSLVYLDVFVSSCVSCGLFYTLFRMAVSRVKLIQCCSETWKLELIDTLTAKMCCAGLEKCCLVCNDSIRVIMMA